MSCRSTAILVSFTSVLVSLAGGLRADVFNMPAGQTSVQFVTVGDPGNAADPTVDGARNSNHGSVGYVYQMGKFDVTAAQYCQFLNAVAATDDYSLYDPYMNVANYSQSGGCNIIQNGSWGSYTYSVASDWANRPVNYITWGDAARFVNWLANGQPTGAQGLSTTEDGAYFLNGAMSDAQLGAITRKSGARYFIPTEDEWYKAAYYKGGGANAGYWTYPTRSNTAPSNLLSSTGTNNACFWDNAYTVGPPYYRSEVGALAASPGPYGTFDQGGDVYQWNETVFFGTNRGTRGGAYNYGSFAMNTTDGWGFAPAGTFGDYRNGFRVAGVSLLAGDANGDGKVDVEDLNKVLTNYNHSGMTWSQGDFDGNGMVEVADLNKLLTNYNNTAASAGPRAVPEPGTLAWLGVGAIWLVGVARRPSRKASP